MFSLSSLLSNLNYGTIFFLMLLESTVIPVPSELVVAPAAYHAAGGNVHIVLVIIAATLGADCGATINYVVSYYVGRPLVYKFANSRFGHMCLIDEAKVQKAEAYFDKRGNISTLVGRMIPAIRQLISIPAGLAKMNLGSFILFTCLGAAIWNGILVLIGHICHTQIDKATLIGTISHYSHIIGIGAIILVIGIIGFLIYQGLKPVKKADSTTDSDKE